MRRAGKTPRARVRASRDMTISELDAMRHALDSIELGMDAQKKLDRGVVDPSLIGASALALQRTGHHRFSRTGDDDVSQHLYDQIAIASKKYDELERRAIKCGWTKPQGNPSARLTAEQRRVLEDLIASARKSGDDWGITDAVDEYLGDESDERTPLEYLSAVDADVDYHHGHAGDPPVVVYDDDGEILRVVDVDRQSADRAQQQVADAIHKLRALNPAPAGESLQQIARRLAQGITR